MDYIFIRSESGERRIDEDMIESEKRKQINSAKKHNWVKIGNGYSKCYICGLIKYQKSATSPNEYLKNNISVENTGCTVFS